jgi:hypothetical protein
LGNQPVRGERRRTLRRSEHLLASGRVLETHPSERAVRRDDIGHPSARPLVEDPSLRSAVESIRHLVESADPGVVFGSLARICAAGIADECIIDLVEYGHAPQRICSPSGASGPKGSASWRVDFGSAPDAADPYFGVAKFVWRERDPTRDERMIVSLLVDRAVASVARQRLAREVASARAAVDNLGVALETRERIGIAVGILMQVHNCSSADAFDRMKRVSRRDRRTLRDVAEGVLVDPNIDR